MSITTFRSPWVSILGAALLAGLTLQRAFAGPLAIVDSPLFLGAGVKPNLILAMDDSGSMDFEVLLQSGDGAAWWQTASSGACTTNLNSFTGCARNASATSDVVSTGTINFNVSGAQSNTWIKFAYLFPNGCDSSNTSYERRLCDGTIDHFAIAPIGAFSFFRSSDFNPLYFNPNTTYSPWVNGGGYTFTNATATAARYDPVFGTASNALDLTHDVAGSTSGLATLSTGSSYNTTSCTDTALSTSITGNFSFRVYTGMTLPAGTCFFANTNGASHWQVVAPSNTCQVGVSGSCKVNVNGGSTVVSGTLSNATAIAIRYFPATFYLKSSAELPAGYGYTGTTLTGTAPDGTSLVGYEIKPANFSSTALYTAAMQNFANWFTYDRKRHQALRSGLGAAFSPMTGMKISGFRMNNLSTSITMGDIDVSADRSTLYQNFYANWIASGGTPTQHTINALVTNFRRTDSAAPVQYSCQKNFGFLFTDGYANDPGFLTVGNVDGTAGAPYADSTSNTIADLVMSAYNTPLRSGAGFSPGMVGVPAACSKPGHDASLDCNANLHMNFYTVTLGTKGVVYNPDAVPAQDPYANPPTWPATLVPYNPVMVDDLWHATINGRGLLLNAKSGDDIATKLAAVLQDIINKTGSAASASVNSGSINSDTRVFQAQFNSTSWSGELLSFRVLPDGTFDSNGAWQASTVMPTPDQRQIFTVNSNGAGTKFRWGASLDATRQSQLQQTDTTTIASARVDYLRGVRTQEIQNGGAFRNRASALGDIINSAPVFVGAPAFRYSDSLETAPYSSFKAAQANRTQAVYVGANDGMLHAFRADSGQELFAFIPGGVFANLYKLTQPSYTHRYYVDGSPTEGDAFFGGSWHTVLASGLNAGGQSVFALDITHADAYTETGSTTPLLWEFTDAQDADLGDTFSRPAIVRMHNGHWAAIFGNGYNNTAADTYVSTTGDAVLYVVDLATGALLAKIDTQAGMAQDPTGKSRPNGLATVAVVDADSDGIADYAYAGDLFGNLWKFSLTDSNPANWGITYSAVVSGATKPAPLFVAINASNVRQPITSKPSISRGPNGIGFVVLFGTGKYLESGDTTLANLTTESFYGIIDKNTGASSDVVSGRSVLTQQTITKEFSQTFGSNTYNIRTTSQNVVPASSLGWYIDLVSPANGFEGEMQVTDSIIRENQIIFTTLIPNSDPCSYGGRSWLMALNLFSGAFLNQSPFDLNGDGSFNSNDYANGPNGAQPVSGIQTSVGITPTPADLSNNPSNGGGAAQCPGDYLIMPGTTGQLQTVCRNAGPRAIGRQSWRQIR